MSGFGTSMATIAIALVTLTAWAPAEAGRLSYVKSPQILAQQQKNFAAPRLLSKSQAAAMATSRHGGKVLKVESTDTRGDYRVRLLLDSGRIKTVSIRSPKGKKNT